MVINTTIAAPTRRKKIAQDKERSDAALGHASPNTSDPEGAKEGCRLPHGWSEQRIEQLFAPLEDGRTLHQGWSPQCDKVPSPSEGVWGVLKTTSIQAGKFRPEHNKLLPSKLAPRPLIEVKEGDILLTCAGPRVRCGVSCLVRQTRRRLMMSGKMYRFRVDADRTDARYVEAFLQTERARLAIDKMKTGSSDSGLNLTHARFRQLVIPVAPLLEQRRIVAEIEKQFTRLEAGVTALRRVQANLKRYRAAVLKAACEGRLVSTEAELAKTENREFQTGEELLARILTERRQKWQGRGQYKEPAELNTANLPPLPEGWSWARLEQLAITFGGLTKNPKRAKLPRRLPYLRVANVYANELRLEEMESIGVEDFELAKLLVRAGDLLIVEGNGSKSQIGRLAIWDGSIDPVVHQNHIIKVRTVEGRMPKWILHWLQSPNGRHFVELVASSTSGLYTLSVNKVGDLPIALPPLSEQTRIVAEVERRLSVVDTLEAAVSAQLTRATRLRQSVLQSAFNKPYSTA